MEKELKTERILNSLNGMQRAEASPFLFTRIQEKLQQKMEVYPGVKVSLRTVFLSLSGLALLLFLNLYSAKNFKSDTTDKSTQEVADDYGLGNQNGFYY